ncbi:DUF6636 domain-containing protein [Nocardia yunnanensis]|nr:DUF6636 domain-containing protein [Nocardia yunnanensis]
MRLSIRAIAGAAGALAMAAAPAVAQASPYTDQVDFNTPSGNIGCTVSSAGAACEIADHDYPAPARPDVCHLAYGDRIYLDADGAQFHCHGDKLVESSAQILAYTHSVTVGRFTCVSTVDYVECSGPAHSFRLARGFYSLA